ncbi:ABC transporter substrate-binding protein [Rhodococcus erythropolis]|uniref:ABC transporter substrate-binding protein n=1 Tax=Rhodococcus erythropolis TaxID=1833 RepID=UPI00380011FF
MPIKRSLGVASLMITLVLAGCAGGTSTTDQPNAEGNLSANMMGGQGSFAYAPTEMLQPSGIAKENGLDLTYEGRDSNSANMLAALISRDVDFVVPSPQATIDSIQQGADLVVVGVPVSLNISTMVLRSDVAAASRVGTSSPAVDKLQALRGLTIATSPSGSGNNAVLRALLSEAGLDPEKDVTIVGVNDKAAIVAGINSDTFEGAFFTNGILEQNIVNGSAVKWISTSSGETDDLLRGEMPGLFIVTRKDVVENSPGVVDKTYSVMNTMLAQIANDPTTFGNEVYQKSFTATDKAVFDLAWEESVAAYPATAGLSRASFDALIALQGGADKYDKVDYDTIVLDAAKS